MCNSNSTCRAIRKAIKYMPLKEHEEQLGLCHKCITEGNSFVSDKQTHKTDLEMRLSYVKKYQQHLKQLRAQA